MHENFYHKLKVYYEDTDAGGVVYYANYLKFLERARTEALFSIGFSNKKIQENYNSLIIVKSCNIEYKKPAHLEDELKVRSFVKSITKTSFFMNQIISRENNQKFDDLALERVIGSPKKIVINKHTSSELAVIGSGDVLAGIITSLVGDKKMSIIEAASAATWIHGDIAKRYGKGMISEDLIKGIPAVLKKLKK